MRGARRSIANIWAVASRIKGYYGKRDPHTGRREACWTGGAGARAGADGAGRARLRGWGWGWRRPGFCSSDCGTGRLGPDARLKGGGFLCVGALPMEMSPVF